MASRVVLVSYMERNKVLKIPNSRSKSDYECLTEEFRKEFKYDSNVSLSITFQRFDKDWEEYVDLDESCTFVNKEKLRAVVSPMLKLQSSPSQSGTESVVSKTKVSTL